MKSMKDEHEEEWQIISYPGTEEEAIEAFAESLGNLTSHVQQELKRGVFDEEKVNTLMTLLSVVIREYDFITLKNKTIH
jgi:surfactin synthase thioesterase subunit